jgi:hypothetical protein
MPGWTFPFRISIDFAFLKNILSAIVFSLICVFQEMIGVVCSTTAFKLILQANPRMAGKQKLSVRGVAGA